jgi:hypothetical protein
MLLLARLRDDIALLLKVLSKGSVYAGLYWSTDVATYWHFGRKAAITMAPKVLSSFPLRLAFVMEVFRAAGLCTEPNTILASVLWIK